MDYWSKTAIDREQIPLFTPTLGDMIAQDHPVRLLDEILGGRDWGAWEARYPHKRGQPPIHPQVMAGAILYGLNHGIRSSRKLEEACINRLDFIWLVKGRTIDHSTFAQFRTAFGDELKDLFSQIGRLAMRLGLIHLVEIATDGTRVKANNSRHRTGTAATLEQRLATLDEQIEQALSEMATNDRQDDARLGADGSTTHLPTELATLTGRREALAKALNVAEEADQARQKVDGKSAKPVQVPLTDPDAKVQPNKEGGFAPNYTPMATTDGARGFVVDEDVIPGGAEAVTVPAMLDRVEAVFGRLPTRLFGDGAYGVGQNLETFESRAIEAFTPIESGHSDTNPAIRPNPSQPVPEDRWQDLPMNAGTKKLDRAAFIYNEQTDDYHCPMGRRLTYAKSTRKANMFGSVPVRIYRCHDCRGCLLAERCLSARNMKGRTVRRDPYELQRQRMIHRMSQADSKLLYKRRMWIAETPFAHLKTPMGIRQFLLRGLRKVRIEWRWSCAAMNLGKLVRALARIRVDLAAAAA